MREGRNDTSIPSTVTWSTDICACLKNAQQKGTRRNLGSYSKVLLQCIQKVLSRAHYFLAHYNEERGTHRRKDQIHIHFARPQQFLRSFQPQYVRFGNLIACTTNITSALTFQDFKEAVHIRLFSQTSNHTAQSKFLGM